MKTRYILASTALISLLAVTGSTHAASVTSMLKQAGVDRGLCLHLGCGGMGREKLTADLADKSDLLVHGIARDQKACDKVRSAIRKRGMQGKAQVEVLAGRSLPYVDGVADLVILDDRSSLSSKGITSREIDRVLAPGGVKLTRSGSRWKKSVKKRDPKAGTWTHPFNGPDGNRVATKPVAFPVGLRWQEGLPINIVTWGSTRSWIAAGGRVFGLTMTDGDNLRTGNQKFVNDQWLTARSGASGLPLWKVALGTTDGRSDLAPMNSLPIATDGELVLVRKENGLVAVRATDGKVVRSYPVSFPPIRLLMTDGIAITSGWEGMIGRKMWVQGIQLGSSLWDVRTPKTDRGAVEAFDVASGRRLWQDAVPGQTVFVSDGLAVYLVQGKAPVTAQSIVARDAKTGREKWRVSHTKLGVKPDMFLAGVGSKVVVLARHQSGTENFQMRCSQVLALSLANGRKLWQKDEHGDAMCLFVKGEVWYGSKRFNPATGAVLGRAPFGVTRGMCLPPVLVGDVGGAPRGGSWSNTAKGGQVRSGGVRGGCIQGVAVADDQMYISQNWCRCAPAQVPGFVSMGSETPPADSAYQSRRPVEKPRSSFSRPRSSSSRRKTSRKAATWLTFRGDAERSGSCAARAPSALAVRWRASVVPKKKHALVDVWRDSLQQRVSAPVTDGKNVYVASCNEGELVAMDLATGRVRWRAGTGARIDSPPTIHKEMCLVGSHDGWVYAFGSTDGAMKWRTRIAPVERRMAAFGQVESSWPVVGSPLLIGGMAYAFAGRSTEMDGGCALVAFDPASGTTKWATKVLVSPGRRSDVLAAHDGNVAMQHLLFDAKSGAVRPSPESLKERVGGNLDGMLDASWTRIGNRRSGNHGAGKVPADVVVWDDDTWYGYSTNGAIKGCFAISKGAARSANPKNLGAASFKWKWQCPGDRQVEALVLARGGLVAAGRVKNNSPAQLRGFITVIGSADGRKGADVALSAPVAHHGICVVQGRVIAALEDGTVTCLVGR